MTETIQIFSENNDFQYIETLRRNRNKRNRTQTFFVEGVNAINQALAYQWDFEVLVFVNDHRLSDWAAGILQKSEAKKHYSLPKDLMEKISEKDNPSELVAILRSPSDDLLRIPLKEVPLVVVLDRVASPGNLGTIIRSCDALGVDGVILTGHAADLYAPETIRATTGSFFAVPVIRVPAPKEILSWLAVVKETYPSLQVVATSAKADELVDAHDFTQPTILLIGNENHGLSVFYRELADISVTIPMSGSASSLNVACATSVILYEIKRQRKSLV